MGGYGVSSFMEGAMRGYGFADDVIARRDRQAEETRRWGITNDRAQDVHEAKMEEYGRTADEAKMKDAYAVYQAGGDLTDEHLELFTRRGLIPERAQPLDESLSFVEQAMDSGDYARIRTPEGIQALNTIFEADLNTDSQGRPLRHKVRMEDIVPGQEPGTVAVAVGGEYEDGTPFSGQPITKGRSSDTEADTEVMQVPVSELVNRVRGLRLGVEAYKRDPEFRQRLASYAKAKGWTGGTEDGAPEVKTFYDEKTGQEYKAQWDRAKGQWVRVGGVKADKPGSGKSSTQSKKFHEMVALGVPPEVARGVAYGTYKSVTNPATGATTVVDLATGQEIGEYKPKDPDDVFRSGYQWESRYPSQGGGDEPRVPISKAMEMAKREAEERDPTGPNILRGDAMKEAYGGLGKEEWINRRAMEISQGAKAQPNREPERATQGGASNTAGPKPGALVDGYRFKGGNPNDQNSWEPAK